MLTSVGRTRILSLIHVHVFISMQGSTEQQHHQLNSILDNLQSKLTELTGPPPDSPSSVEKQSIVLDELR